MITTPGDGDDTIADDFASLSAFRSETDREYSLDSSEKEAQNVFLSK